MVRKPAPALVAALLLSLASPAAAQDTTAADTTIFFHAISRARDRHAQLAGPEGVNDNGAAQYRNALAEIAGRDYASAILRLQAALQRAPRNPMYRSDLGYLVALTGGSLDSAAVLFQQAFSLQQQNGWYLISLALVRAAQQRWADAAGTIEVAAQADSGVVDGRISITAVAYFEQAGDSTRALEWARMATRLAPDEAGGWYILARSYAQRGDTGGMTAARRYNALRPDDQLGKLLLAQMLFLAGSSDSALALAETVTRDTAYRQAASQVFLAVGARLIDRRDLDRGLEVLERGQPMSPPELQPYFAFYMGRAQLVKLGGALSDVEESRNCDQARAAESLVTATERLLRSGESVDTTRARMFIHEVLPNYRRNAVSFRESFCRPQPQRRRPARPGRP